MDTREWLLLVSIIGVTETFIAIVFQIMTYWKTFHQKRPPESDYQGKHRK